MAGGLAVAMAPVLGPGPAMAEADDMDQEFRYTTQANFSLPVNATSHFFVSRGPSQSAVRCEPIDC